MQTNLDV